MRDGLVETKLGQYIHVNTGKLDVNAASEFGEYPFFTCSRETYRIDEAAFEGESVLVAGNGDLNVKYYDGKFNAYQRTYVLNSIDRSILDNRFLFLYMQTYIEYLRSETRGTVIQYLKKAQFTDAKIKLPPLPDQKRIVDLISSVDSYIESLQQQLEGAKKSRNAVLHELMTARGNDWVVRKLPEVVEVLDRMRKPINSTEREDRKGNIPYYGANGQTGWIDEFIFNEELVLLGEDAIDFADPSARKAYLIQGPSWVNNHAHVLRADKTVINSYFLMESLNKVDYSQYVSFGTRSKLTQASMNGIKVLVPSMKNQEKIVDLLANFDEVIEATQKSIGDSKVLRSGMLSNLLSGEHEIPTSYDKFIGAA
jgi:type I restriction enzyme S subunit